MLGLFELLRRGVGILLVSKPQRSSMELATSSSRLVSTAATCDISSSRQESVNRYPSADLSIALSASIVSVQSLTNATNASCEEVDTCFASSLLTGPSRPDSIWLHVSAIPSSAWSRRSRASEACASRQESMQRRAIRRALVSRLTLAGRSPRDANFFTSASNATTSSSGPSRGGLQRTDLTSLANASMAMDIDRGTSCPT
mmetsp:Transcript_4829/g.30685  ORF Transcript_4829/g.30685 Transcript_4829/m.30685 type:complete len:201 (+) Transcript_4829:1336-1938(+)